MEHLKYPIGKFSAPSSLTTEQRSELISRIESLPLRLRTISRELTEAGLESSYRPEGWTARQIFHHLADSHVNFYTRLKLALTEDTPTVKPYDENTWAEIPEARSLPVEPSVRMIEGIHERITATLRGMNEDDFARTYFHPQHGKTFDINYLIAMYAWHGDHHLGHIQIVVNSQSAVLL